VTKLPTSVSRLSRQCDILNISQPYRPSRSVTVIGLIFTLTLKMEALCSSETSRSQLNGVDGISFQRGQISWGGGEPELFSMGAAKPPEMG
jgi:hypothetical protein